MIVAACLGMATKYAEGVLAVKFREDKGGGRFLGGPFYLHRKRNGKRSGHGWQRLSQCLQ